jgi:hypothetical protein
MASEDDFGTPRRRDSTRTSPPIGRLNGTVVGESGVGEVNAAPIRERTLPDVGSATIALPEQVAGDHHARAIGLQQGASIRYAPSGSQYDGASRMASKQKSKNGGERPTDAAGVSAGVAPLGAEKDEAVTPFTHPAPQGSAKKVSEVLGEIAWLMSQSPIHKQFFISDLEWFVMTPVLLQQFRLFYDKDKPIGVVFWAFANQEVAEMLARGTTKLRPQDWKSGD